MSDRTLVLVIDDEVESNATLAMHLEKDGYEVLTATSGTEGLPLTYDHPPDAVILDIRMPGMDRREVCTRLRDITDAVILFFTVLSRWTQSIKTRGSPRFAGAARELSISERVHGSVSGRVFPWKSCKVS